MTRFKRRIILYTIALLFLLAAPVILLHAWGYSFDWTKGKPVLTGGFYFSSIPRKAKVYLDDEIRGSTPLFIQQLNPQEYTVQISKEGYQTWSKRLRVESKLVTEGLKILLVPVDPQLEVVQQAVPGNFDLGRFTDRLDYATELYFVDKTDGFVYKTDENGLNQEQVSVIPLPKDAQYAFHGLADDKIAAWDDNHHLYILKPNTQHFELLSEDVQGFQFSSDEEKLLYFTPSEIWAYYFEDITGQPNKQAGEKELITRLNQIIKKAVWNDYTSAHIFFLAEDAIKMTELDNRDVRNTFNVMRIEADDMEYMRKERKIYVVKDGELLSISME